MATTRQRQIIAAAYALVDAYRYEIPEAANRINQSDDGWTLETPAPLGNTVRHEGVVFAPSELAQVIAQAQRMVADIERAVAGPRPRPVNWGY